MAAVETENIDGTWSIYKKFGQSSSSDNQLHATCSRAVDSVTPHNQNQSDSLATSDILQEVQSNEYAYNSNLDPAFFNNVEPLSSVQGLNSFAIPLDLLTLPLSADGVWTPNFGLEAMHQVSDQGAPGLIGISNSLWLPGTDYRNHLQYLPSKEIEDILDAYSKCSENSEDGAISI